jgi:hypothetical protein
MDPETLEVVEKAIAEGISSNLWILLLGAVISAALGAYFGSYLMKKGEDAATRENLREVLRQLELQTELTETIKHNLESRQIEDVFLRELYGSSVGQYSSEQAYSLRQTYLLLFEPQSSSVEFDNESLEGRLSIAINLVMQPLRANLGLLDEATIRKIYHVHSELLKLKGRTSEDIKKSKNEIFNETDVARQFVRADRIAFRLGLINRKLEHREDG